MPSTASFTDLAYINSLMDKAVTDTINVQENDVVVMGSDGLCKLMCHCGPTISVMGF